MTIKKGQELELTVSDVAYGGKGLSRIDGGLAVFVDQAVPGDRALVRITRKKKNYAEARIITLLGPSTHRIEPPCPYSGFCGGCKWQFLAYEKQLAYKRRHVEESLEHIGGIYDIPVHAPIASQRRFGYRNKMEFTCSDRKWLLPQEMGAEGVKTDFALGLHVPGTFYKVLDTKACLLQPDMGNEILDDIRTYIQNSAEPVYGLRSHRGFWRFVMLRHSFSEDRWMVNLITASENLNTIRPLADRLMQRHPRIGSFVNNITARKAGVAVGEYERHIAGESKLTDHIDGFRFDISANSFFQTNTAGAERLYRTVREYAALTGSETVLDLYSGTGTIAICLSSAAKEVIGVELVESAVRDARTNSANNRVSNCRFIQDDIRNGLARIDTKPDVMIIDPPRAGMHKDVVRQVLDLAPERIVYVSCNPASLARDLGMIKDVYRTVEVQPVDLFPHTYHIESVARLEKK